MGTRTYDDLAQSGEINDIYISGTEEANRVAVMGDLSSFLATGSTEDWTDVSAFTNNWENNSVIYQTRYKINPLGTVFIEGLIDTGIIDPGITGYIFQLPEGYRPTKILIFNCIGSSNTIVEIRIDTFGYVHAYGSSNDANAQVWTSLANISFQGE